MDFKHELVFPDDGLPFKMFVFEGKEGNYKVSRHWHRSVEIFLVLEGTMDFYINTELFTLGMGQFILVNPNEVHSIDCPYPNFTIVMQIPSSLFETYVGNMESMLFCRSCPAQDAQLVDLISNIYKSNENKQCGYQFRMLSDFYQLLYLMVKSYRILEVDEERRRQNKNLEKLSKITDYVNENYTEDLTLEGVARVFGYSPTYLSKMFHKYAGVNYKSYVLDLRTEAGYRLLMNTRQSVLEIAIECGFPDSRSFANAFRKRYGMAPTEYRKKRR